MLYNYIHSHRSVHNDIILMGYKLMLQAKRTVRSRAARLDT